MKRIIVIASFLFLLPLVACNPKYTGKEVASIEYVVIDYNGGYTTEKVINLLDFEVLKRGYLPLENEEVPEFEVIHTFEEKNISNFMNQLSQANFFNMKDHYSPSTLIIDGSGWSIKITYKDGTVKTSTGDNSRPEGIFQKSDYAFYNLFGEDFFGTLPSGFKFPPIRDIAFHYIDGNNNYSNGFGLSSTNATWNKYEVKGVDNIQNAIDNQKYYFNVNHDYKLVIWTANDKYRFKNFEIKSYNLEGNDEKTIDNLGWFTQKDWIIEFDRVYVIRATYKEGVVEYAFSTKLDNN